MSQAGPLVILKTGTTHTSLCAEQGDFEDWILAGVRWSNAEARVVDTEADGELPARDSIAGVVITGSHDMVTDSPDWLESVAAWLRSVVAASVPTLGICYGHQLLAHAAGGRVEYSPGGRETGSVMIELLPDGETDPLLGIMPREFPAHVNHSQSVVALPPGAVRLARSGSEATHAFRIGGNAWGLQFHPEFSEAVMLRYLELEAADLEREGRDVESLAKTVRPSPAGRLLARFGELLRAP